MTNEELRDEVWAAWANDGRLELTSLGIPVGTFEDLCCYELNHRPVGDFLYAVLCNDLAMAFGYADEHNLAALPKIVSYCWTKLARRCWGSPEKVKAWLAQRDDAKLTDEEFRAKWPF